MPFIFIHGVNTRKGDRYSKNLSTRDELIRRLILKPLADKYQTFEEIEIVNPYWGDYGARFSWNLASLPKVSTLEHLGAQDDENQGWYSEFMEYSNQLAGTDTSTSSEVERLGSEEGLFKRSAEANLTAFVEAVLSSIILPEMHFGDEGDLTPQKEGILEALLAMAGANVAEDPSVIEMVARANSNEEVLDTLSEQVQIQFELLVREEFVDTEGIVETNDGLETLGGDWIDDLNDKVGEFFSRALEAPSRAASLAALNLFRQKLHSQLIRFVGDVFVYLNERGTKAKPGKIIETILKEIQDAVQNQPEEPLIIMTHSMGGNILYDLVTYYSPDLKIDVWISVASQVAQFEEMKLFRSSDRGITTPDKVTGLKQQVGYWLNVYDPADSFSFLTEPVFADVTEDLEYLTGSSALKAHGEYFGRASFYRIVREHIERALE